MKFSPGQTVKWKGKRVEIIRAHWYGPGSGHQIYRIRVLEDTYKSGAITSVYEFMLHPISPLELLARTWA